MSTEAKWLRSRTTEGQKVYAEAMAKDCRIKIMLYTIWMVIHYLDGIIL